MCLDHGGFPKACHRRGGGMFLRAAGIFTALLIGLAGSAGPAFAQLFPFPPSAPRYVPPPMRPLPPVDVDDDAPAYDPPPGYRQGGQQPYALPPPGNEPTYVPPPPQFGRAYPQDQEPYPPPPAGLYRDQPPAGVY